MEILQHLQPHSYAYEVVQGSPIEGNTEFSYSHAYPKSILQLLLNPQVANY